MFYMLYDNWTGIEHISVLSVNSWHVDDLNWYNFLKRDRLNWIYLTYLKMFTPEYTSWPLKQEDLSRNDTKALKISSAKCIMIKIVFVLKGCLELQGFRFARFVL